jgi:phosphoribosyl-ATP pyrophosphohydrolase
MTDILKKLNSVLNERKDKNAKESYVASLYEKGLDHTCNKVKEESNELINALKNESNERIISEAADLWFHSLVALSMKNLSSDDILIELEKRFGVSGITEKNSRNDG